MGRVMYEIFFEHNDDMLYVKASGEQTLENNRRLALYITEKMKKLGIKKLFLDSHGFIGQPGTFADYDLADFVSPLTIGGIEKIAFFHPVETSEYSRFFETAARNKGINIRAFTLREKAEEWLKSED